MNFNLNVDHLQNKLHILIRNEFNEWAQQIGWNVTTEEQDHIIELIGKITVVYIFPFGSRLYGTETTQSDLDLLVVVENLRDVQLFCKNENHPKTVSNHSLPHLKSSKDTTLTRSYGEIHFNSIYLNDQLADVGVYDTKIWFECINQQVICMIKNKLCLNYVTISQGYWLVTFFQKILRFFQTLLLLLLSISNNFD